MVVECQDDVAMGVRVITEEVAGKRRGMVNADARTESLHSRFSGVSVLFCLCVLG